jgi:hypothetical protein
MAAERAGCWNRGFGLSRAVLLEQASVLLVDMPRLVREMIEAAVLSEGDLVLVGSVGDPAALREATRRVRPRLVVLGARSPALPNDCSELFEELPRLIVVGIHPERGHAYFHSADQPVKTVNDIDPAALARLIREHLASGD